MSNKRLQQQQQQATQVWIDRSNATGLFVSFLSRPKMRVKYYSSALGIGIGD